MQQDTGKLCSIAALDVHLEKGKEISRKHLVNALNYTNFQDGTILLNFKHNKYDKIIPFKARPQPCLGETLECHWTEPAGLPQRLKSYTLLHLFLTDGQKLICAKPEVNEMTEKGITLSLPERCFELKSRRVKRYPCEGIHVELIQHSVLFKGSLIDFSALSFRIELTATPPQTFQWISPAAPVTVMLRNEVEIIYTGECRILKQSNDQSRRTFVVEPLHHNIRRFKPKELRSSRQKLSPSPGISFKHPLSGKTVSLEVVNLSGSGLLVEESYDNSVLLAGMIIPHLEIEFATDFRIRGKAQIVYRNIHSSEGAELQVRCGIAFLNIDMQNQARLSALLHHVINRKTYVCNKIDLDDLWKFFFEAGFIYPEKYSLIQADKDQFKKTYERLYLQSPHIARHFVYKDQDRIQGHISMIRFYENTWLFHHHASRATYSRAGLIVLDQISRYVNDFYRLYSTHMNFIMSYFRPDNKFPNRIFGGFSHSLNDPKGSSYNAFAYFQFPKSFEPWDASGEVLIPTTTTQEDLLELESSYEHESGGLMLKALDLDPHRPSIDSINNEYQNIGFTRQRHLFSLKKDGALKAIVMVNVSDIGLNLSSVTNSLHVFVIDPDGLSRQALFSALSMLSKYYEQDSLSVLLYPLSYAESQSITYDKVYNLWVLDVPHAGEQYLKFMEKVANRTYRE